MTFAQYLGEVAHRKNFNPSWRMGQTYFNVLMEVRPILAEKVRASAVDPFYNDNMIGQFLTRVCNEWDVYRPM